MNLKYTLKSGALSLTRRSIPSHQALSIPLYSTISLWMVFVGEEEIKKSSFICKMLRCLSMSFRLDLLIAMMHCESSGFHFVGALLSQLWNISTFPGQDRWVDWPGWLIVQLTTVRIWSNDRPNDFRWVGGRDIGPGFQHAASVPRP